MSRNAPGSLLVIDAGNTRVKCGLFDAAAPPAGVLPVCRRFLSVAPDAKFPFGDVAEEFAATHGGVPGLLTGSNPAAVASVQAQWPADWPAPKRLQDVAELPIVVEVDHPERVGVDRLLNAVAANRIREPGQRVIIVDSGTATTVDYVDETGRFRGGAILPGFDLCAHALHQYTALLPLIRLREVQNSDAPPDEIGRNTEAAMTSGLYWGHVGAVKELTRRLMHAGEAQLNPLLLLTGGAAPLLYPHLSTIIRHEPHLALQGLALAALALDEPSHEEPFTRRTHPARPTNGA